MNLLAHQDISLVSNLCLLRSLVNDLMVYPFLMAAVGMGDHSVSSDDMDRIVATGTNLTVILSLLASAEKV